MLTLTLIAVTTAVAGSPSPAGDILASHYMSFAGVSLGSTLDGEARPTPLKPRPASEFDPAECMRWEHGKPVDVRVDTLSASDFPTMSVWPGVLWRCTAQSGSVEFGVQDGKVAAILIGGTGRLDELRARFVAPVGVVAGHLVQSTTVPNLYANGELNDNGVTPIQWAVIVAPGVTLDPGWMGSGFDGAALDRFGALAEGLLDPTLARIVLRVDAGHGLIPRERGQQLAVATNVSLLDLLEREAGVQAPYAVRLDAPSGTLGPMTTRTGWAVEEPSRDARIAELRWAAELSTRSAQQLVDTLALGTVSLEVVAAVPAPGAELVPPPEGFSGQVVVAPVRRTDAGGSPDDMAQLVTRLQDAAADAAALEAALAGLPEDQRVAAGGSATRQLWAGDFTVRATLSVGGTTPRAVLLQPPPLVRHRVETRLGRFDDTVDAAGAQAIVLRDLRRRVWLALGDAGVSARREAARAATGLPATSGPGADARRLLAAWWAEVDTRPSLVATLHVLEALPSVAPALAAQVRIAVARDVLDSGWWYEEFQRRPASSQLPAPFIAEANHRSLWDKSQDGEPYWVPSVLADKPPAADPAAALLQYATNVNSYNPAFDAFAFYEDGASRADVRAYLAAHGPDAFVREVVARASYAQFLGTLAGDVPPESRDSVIDALDRALAEP